MTLGNIQQYNKDCSSSLKPYIIAFGDGRESLLDNSGVSVEKHRITLDFIHFAAVWK